jgi:hypothetical protein
MLSCRSIAAAIRAGNFNEWPHQGLFTAVPLIQRDQALEMERTLSRFIFNPLFASNPQSQTLKNIENKGFHERTTLKGARL